MTWQEALEIVVGRTKHERFRELCADDHPGHKGYREQVVRMADDQPLPDIEAHLAEASGQPAQVKPCGGCP